MTPDLISLIVSALVGAGGLAGVTQLYKAFVERKKVPADINLAVLGGAEKALMVMKQALDDAEERIIQLKAEIAEERQFHHSQMAAKNQEIQNLQNNLHLLREQFTTLARQLDRIQSEVEAVQDDQSNY